MHIVNRLDNYATKQRPGTAFLCCPPSDGEKLEINPKDYIARYNRLLPL